MAGTVVLTKTGRLGELEDKHQLINGKVPVYLINEQGNRTGLNMMCDPSTLTIKGRYK